MGVSNQFEEARELCRNKLGFDISGEAQAFRMLLDRAGKKRLELAVRGVELWQRPGVHGLAKYERLMKILELVTPPRAGKPRNTAVGAAKEAHAALDAELGDILRREP
jgi:hypothetical protein